MCGFKVSKMLGKKNLSFKAIRWLHEPPLPPKKEMILQTKFVVLQSCFVFVVVFTCHDLFMIHDLSHYFSGENDLTNDIQIILHISSSEIHM